MCCEIGSGDYGNSECILIALIWPLMLAFTMNEHHFIGVCVWSGARGMRNTKTCHEGNHVGEASALGPENFYRTIPKSSRGTFCEVLQIGSCRVCIGIFPNSPSSLCAFASPSNALASANSSHFVLSSFPTIANSPSSTCAYSCAVFDSWFDNSSQFSRTCVRVRHTNLRQRNPQFFPEKIINHEVPRPIAAPLQFRHDATRKEAP